MVANLACTLVLHSVEWMELLWAAYWTLRSVHLTAGHSGYLLVRYLADVLGTLMVANWALQLADSMAVVTAANLDSKEALLVDTTVV
jgi:hypothetical protein